jgi:phosphoribosylaminoimidazole-succinocarboxamide synthase
MTAFNGEKKDELEGKGALNRDLASFVFRHLKERGISSHWRADVGTNDMICEDLSIIPLEVVVRNRLAGSTAKRLGFAEGHSLECPLVEFYYKNDDLGDPFLSDAQALLLKAVSHQDELDRLKSQALRANEVLKELFLKSGIELIDFKLEYGRNSSGDIVLGDEISPDSCRLWELGTGRKLDKDRFRRNLGDVMQSYQEVWTRLQKAWGEKQ